MRRALRLASLTRDCRDDGLVVRSTATVLARSLDNFDYTPFGRRRKQEVAAVKIAVIGAGAMGRWSVKDLGLSSEVAEIVVADRDSAVAREVAASHGGGKAQGVFVDASDATSLAPVIAGCDALVNATQHFWNLTVMRAAAAASVHYTDLGGLFHVTKEQLTLDDEFKKAGVTAVISMGGAPGATNVLARYGAQQVDTVEGVQALCGNVDNTDWSSYDGWLAPYSLETICDEFSVPAPQFVDGVWDETITGGDGDELIDFGEPAGMLHAHYTIHSEPITFYHTWKQQGLQSATWKLALPEAFTEQMRFLARIGMTSKDEVEVGGVRVRPRDVLLKVVSQLPRPQNVVLDDVDYLFGIVRGVKDGRRVEWRVRAVIPAHKGFGAGAGDVDTGIPPAIVARMLASGEISGPGVFTPEQVVPCEQFFTALKRWGVTVDAEMHEIIS
jgi:lysine 6-dehydrogenase